MSAARNISEEVVSAAGRGDLESLESLIDEWIAEDELPPNDFTPKKLRYALYTAICRNQVPAAWLLLKRGAIADGDAAEAAATATFPATRPETCQLLIDHGWHINEHTSDGLTMLTHILGDPRRAALIPWALEHGADPNVCSKDENYNALDVAASVSTPDILALLVAHGGCLATSHALHFAAMSHEPGRIEVLSFLLGPGGMDINAWSRFRKLGRRRQNHTALGYAFKVGNKEIVKFLLAKGADPKVRDPRRAEDDVHEGEKFFWRAMALVQAEMDIETYGEPSAKRLGRKEGNVDGGLA